MSGGRVPLALRLRLVLLSLLLLLALRFCLCVAASSSAAASANAATVAPWNLAGARLFSAVKVSPEDGAATAAAAAAAASIHVRWTAPPVAAVSGAPQLLYSVHAQSEDALGSSLVCEAAHPALDCLGARPATALRAQPLSLHLVIACSAGSLVEGRRCPMTMSPPLQLSASSSQLGQDEHFPQPPPGQPARAAAFSRQEEPNLSGRRTARDHWNERRRMQAGASAGPLSADCVPSVEQPPDAELRAVLCDFFNVTRGSHWQTSFGWCDPIPVCQWYGLTCDASGHVTDMNLAGNSLQLVPPATNMDFLWPALPYLQTLYLSDEGLGSFNLSTLECIAQVTLVSFMPSMLAFNERAPLIKLDLGNSALSFDARQTPQLQTLLADSQPVTFDFAQIRFLPQLHTASFDQTALSTAQPVELPDGRRISGSELTHWLLSNLDSLTPQLDSLSLSATALDFGSCAGGSNLPSIRSASLSYLEISDLPLCTTAAGAGTDWLAGMPSLHTLYAQNLNNLVLDTDVFWNASAALSRISFLTTRFVGTAGLNPLRHLSQLASLTLESGDMHVEIPDDPCKDWPNIVFLDLRSNAVYGALPSFRNCSQLQQLALSMNQLSSPIPADFLQGTQVSSVQLGHNQLYGELPTELNLPQLTVLDLSSQQPGLTGTPLRLGWNVPQLSTYLAAGNNFTGGWPQNGWQQVMPLLNTLDLSGSIHLGGSLPADWWTVQGHSLTSFFASNCGLEGAIPPVSSQQVRHLVAINLSLNKLRGSLPANLSATSYLLNDNYLSGPVLLDLLPGSPIFQSAYISVLSVANNLAMRCPVQLGLQIVLTRLELQNAGFDGCNFNVDVILPQNGALTYLDISDNAWSSDRNGQSYSFYLITPIGLQTLIARNASIGSLGTPSSGGSALQTVVLDSNCLDVGKGSLTVVLNLASAVNLRSFSCVRCCLAVYASQLTRLMGVMQMLEEANFAENGVYGLVPASWFDAALNQQQSDGSISWPVSLRALNFSHNPRLMGTLPPATLGYNALASIDLSATGIEGDLPTSWGNFPTLQQLDVSATDLRCSLQLQGGQLLCNLPPSQWVSQAGLSDEARDASSGAVLPGAHCPLLAMANTAGPIALDETFSQLALCQCAAPYFGAAGVCVECPQGCSCSQGMISDCWPTVLPGVAAPATSAFGQGLEIVSPLRIAVLHPCPRLPNGTSLCSNPQDTAQWPLFFVATGTDAETAVPDLSEWCWPGHTGRWCSQCRDGFFSSGRLCKHCLSNGLHVLIVVANAAALLAVVVYLFKQQRSAAQAQKELDAYLTADNRAAAGLSRSLSAVDADLAQPPHAVAHAIALRPDAAEIASAGPAPSDASSNPLRVLLFHTQQLGLLMDSAAALPGSLSGLLTVFSSAGNGLSLSSLVALECLSSWTLAHRCWMALAAPAAVGVVALAAHLASCCQIRSRAVDPFAAAERRLSPSGSSVFAPQRVYSLCGSLLYLFVFPCATVALTALGCTERSEAVVDPSRVYLNLQPYQRCDAQWRREILPPALLAALFWCVLFPLGSTWALWRARRRVHRARCIMPLQLELNDSSTEPLHPSSPAAGAARLRSAAASAWLLSCEQLSPYRPQFWYYEQVLLARRLLLACVVAVVPSGSLYVPLLLLSLIQLAALLQHWARPFRSEWLNRAELASLYLLLLNYLAAVVLQSGMSATGNTDARAADEQGAAWLIALLLFNLAFLLALVGGLFAFVRRRAAVHWPRIREALLDCLANTIGAPAGPASDESSAPSGDIVAALVHEHGRNVHAYDEPSQLDEPLL